MGASHHRTGRRRARTFAAPRRRWLRIRRPDLSMAHLRMDDRLWQTVWEHNLNPVERHDVAVAVWRRADPGDPFASLVGWELAHRWRVRARNLAALYLLWVAFWGALTWATTRSPDGPWGAPVTMTVLGVLALAGCAALRRRMRPVVDGRTAFSPAVPTPTEPEPGA